MAIGRAIVRDPKVYLFDEPLSNLEAALRVAKRIQIAQLIGSPAMNLPPGVVTPTGQTTTVKLTGGATAQSIYPTTADDLGLSVNVGVRPEDMLIAPGKDYVYEGRVSRVDALGKVTLLYFDTAPNPVIGKLPGIHSDLRGNTVRMIADASKVHLFHNRVSLLYR